MSEIKKENNTTKNNSKKRTLTKVRNWSDAKEYQKLVWRPDKEEWRETLIATLYEWATSEKALEIEQFCFEWKIARRTLYDWKDMYPEIKEALNEVKLIIASRRRLGALHRKFDKDVVYKDMHVLDPEYREINKYWADMKQKEQEGSKSFTVIMEPAKETDVKPKE